MGSFFKLIQSFALEIGSLRKELGRKSECEGEEPIKDGVRLSEEVGGLFLQATPRAVSSAGVGGVRDSGYHSLHRGLSVLDRLVHTHTVWLQLGLNQQEATCLLVHQPPGTFLVRRSSSLQRKVLSLRMDQDSPLPVRDFLVRESQYTFSLEGSGLSFADLFRLVAFCCISRDVLPFTLKLPQPITAARTSADLQEVARLGAGFWDAEWKERRRRLTTPHRPPPPAPPHRPPSAGACPLLQTRPPADIECCQSNGALGFINPLFMKLHQAEGADVKAPPTEGAEESRKSETEDPPPSSSIADTEQVVPRSPPSRPPPPHFPVQRSAPPPHQRAMPEKIPWSRDPKPSVEEKEKGGGLLSWLGSSSYSPPKRLSFSSPIPIPSLCHPPDRAKASPSQLEDDQCHLAMEEQTIEKALSRARLLRRTLHTPASTPGDAAGDAAGDAPGDAPGDARDGRAAGLQFSDISTDSSESLDSSFFVLPLPDSSPPSGANLDPLPAPHLHYYMDNGEEGDEEEEEPDNDVSFESDQDQDVTMVPPMHRARRRSSTSALVLRKALQGQLRKMGGVFNSLLTPEKRAVRRVLELSQDKASYFGCLVSDFLGYMSEGAGHVYTSGLEMLQSLRQFMTQMKSYLRQSSEMELPIESLISEDQIDQVLEKALAKCVLKPLRPVVSAALLDFQQRSGAWQELKDNLSLAKARQPRDMGVAGAPPPDPVAIEKIRMKFQVMCKLYSPEKKVLRLLRVCKLIYSIMSNSSGRLYGADDFLPMLTYVLAQCDMPQLDNEILYMMELLDPSQHNGEGGYYLISAYGAMTLIKNLQEEQAERVLSSDTKDTLRQWHSQWQRRRTAQRCTPSIDDFQSYLRVALQDLSSGCTAKTLQVGPYATVEEVCCLCALKFRVARPEDYGLFLLTGGSTQQLAPDTCPQRIKAELHSRAQAAPFHFLYRRVEAGGSAAVAPQPEHHQDGDGGGPTQNPPLN